MKKLEIYVKDIDDTHGFSQDNIVVEHRSNNKKRDFLFVNKAQCMHIPGDPDGTINMCKLLAKRAEQMTKEYKKILVIGFAETATAIGNLVADFLPNCAFVMTTTRENIPFGEKLVVFMEEHSHAPNQQLITYPYINIYNDFDYILFVEDELSTGNTIFNFIEALEEKAKKQKIEKTLKFGVASICNWMNVYNIKEYQKRNIDITALIYGELKDVQMKMDISDYREAPFNKQLNPIAVSNTLTFSKVEERLGHIPNRNLSIVHKYVEKILYNWEIANKITINSIRFIGTEEFKYHIIKIGERLKKGVSPLRALNPIKILCQTTTRSPIDVISLKDGENNIISKYQVPSLYEAGRNNYIYNIDEKVDVNVIMTDVEIPEEIKKEFINLLGDNTLFISISQIDENYEYEF